MSEKNFEDYSNKQYKDISGMINPGMVFICQTTSINDPFDDWDFAVATRRVKIVVLGKFKEIGMARVFAAAVST